MTRNQAGWESEYKKRGALWIHDGNTKRPHAVLRSGLHSNGFFNSREVILMPGEFNEDKRLILTDAVWDLLDIFPHSGGNLDEVTGFVGPQTGATRMAEFLRNAAMEWTEGRINFYASPAKKENGSGEPTMVFEDEEEIEGLPNQNILLCEDVLTTGGSIERTVKAILEKNAKVLPFVLCLVNRSGLAEINGRKIIALISRDLPQWNAAECPLCQQGSEALENVKQPENWKRLNAEY